MSYGQLGAKTAEGMYENVLAKLLNTKETKELLAKKFGCDADEVYVITETDFHADRKKYGNACCLVVKNGHVKPNGTEVDVSFHIYCPDSDEEIFISGVEIKGSASVVSKKQKELLSWIWNKIAKLDDENKNKILDIAIESIKNSDSFKKFTKGKTTKKTKRRAWSEQEKENFLIETREGFEKFLQSLKNKPITSEMLNDFYFENVISQANNDFYIVCSNIDQTEEFKYKSTRKFVYSGAAGNVNKKTNTINKYKGINSGIWYTKEEQEHATKALPLCEGVISELVKILDSENNLSKKDQQMLSLLKEQTQGQDFKGEYVRSWKIYSDDPPRVIIISQKGHAIVEEKKEIADLIRGKIKKELANIVEQTIVETKYKNI